LLFPIEAGEEELRSKEEQNLITTMSRKLLMEQSLLNHEGEEDDVGEDANYCYEEGKEEKEDRSYYQTKNKKDCVSCYGCSSHSSKEVPLFQQQQSPLGSESMEYQIAKESTEKILWDALYSRKQGKISV
jgi:hypothetical protein